MSFAIIIPAQESNKYHQLGDLAPFGATSLLEWKISQCKEFAKSSQIYISSESQSIAEIAKKEHVNFIQRKKDLNYTEMLHSSMAAVETNHIIFLNATSPFIGSTHIRKMYQKFLDEKLQSLITVEKKKEYVFYKSNKLNFGDDFISRKDIEPIFVVTNGCVIINKDFALTKNSLLTSQTNFYEVDSFVATEIKDVKDYSIARDMISIYFKRELDS